MYLAIPLGLLLAAVFFFVVAWSTMIRMPGENFRGDLARLSSHQKQIQDQLRNDVVMLAEQIGERNLLQYAALTQAAEYIETELTSAGFLVERQSFQVRGLACHNLETEIVGSTIPDEIVVVGGHYDSVPHTPGANDNASGTAAMLALARRFANRKTGRTMRFVAWTNEEPPFFQSPDMGSWVYAKRCRQRNENIVAAISLETIGYFQDKRGTQRYPAPLNLFYPSEGDFIGVVGNVGSRKLVRRIVQSFRNQRGFPCQGGALPGSVVGVGWSDHWSFWQEGYPAVMITDTALFRYPYYHLPEDTPDKLNFEKMARVVDGLEAVLVELVE